MDGSTIVAVASVVSSAVVGLWVPSFTARRTDRREALRADREDARDRARQGAELARERLRLSHESVEGDLLELRQLLDAFVDGSFPLISAVVTLQSSSSGDPAPDPGKYSSKLEEHRLRREQIINLQTRMIVRLGREHPACVQAGRFIDAADDAGMSVSTGIWLEQPVPQGPEMWIAGRERMQAERQRLLDIATGPVGARRPELTG